GLKVDWNPGDQRRRTTGPLSVMAYNVATREWAPLSSDCTRSIDCTSMTALHDRRVVGDPGRDLVHLARAARQGRGDQQQGKPTSARVPGRPQITRPRAASA